MQAFVTNHIDDINAKISFMHGVTKPIQQITLCNAANSHLS